MPHRRKGLQLCEDYSTVWVHFCPLEFCDAVADLCAKFVYSLVIIDCVLKYLIR